MVMPEERVSGRQRVREGRYQGVVIPAGRGSVALLAEDPQAVQAVEGRVLGAMRFLD